jgi:hypothetical protein
MAQILVTKPGALNQRDKATLRKSGVVVVEVDDPANVKLLDVSGSALSGDQITLAALKALSSKGVFASDLRETLPAIIADMLASSLELQIEEER